MTTQGQPPRGDAALLKAIETGSPVATNEKQASELREWHRDRRSINTVTISPTKRIVIHHDCHPDDAMDRDVLDALRADADLVSAAPNLHAYAKAEELGDKWRDSQSRKDLNAYEMHLLAMGWRAPQASADFLATYRAAALAKVEGRQS